MEKKEKEKRPVIDLDKLSPGAPTILDAVIRNGVSSLKKLKEKDEEKDEKPTEK